MDMWGPLYDKLRQLAAIPPEEWQAFREMTAERRIPKGGQWVRAGEPTDSIGICTGGLFRFFYTTPDGEEYNKSFCTRLDFVASYSALLLGSPSHFSVQALTDSSLLVVRYADFRSLYDRHPCWERLGRIIVEQLFIKKETRERELLTLSAEARYRLFLDRYGDMARHIPQYHAASYLGITPVALSRIRKKINLG